MAEIVRRRKKNNPVELEYINKVKILNLKLGRTPIQNDFVKAKLGTANTVISTFGNWEGLIKKANIKKIEYEYPIDDDMVHLRNVMLEFKMNPTLSRGTDNYDSLSRLIFCNILADKYPDLKEEVLVKPTKGKRDTNKTRVIKFIKCSTRQSFYHNLRDNALSSLKGYKDYENKYKVIKSGFNRDSKYIKMKELQLLRDQSQEEMVRLMTIILKEY
jgi:hypothetical protein